MTRLLKRPIVFRVLVLALPAVSLVGFAMVPHFRPSGMMAAHMGRQLSRIPKSLVEDHIQQIAKLDLSGTRVLVEAMDHPRELVRSAAAEALHAQLDRWQRLSPSESAPRVARLARLLVARVDQFDKGSRNVAADLALRIVHWPLESPAVSKPELLADCERLLQEAATRPRSEITESPASKDPTGETVMASHAVPSIQTSGGIVDPLAHARLPGGGLPIEETEIPAPIPVPDKGSNASPTADGAPRRFTLPERREPGRLPDSPPEEVSDSVDRDVRPSPSDRDATAKLNSVPSPDPAPSLDQRLEQLSDLDLIHRLTGSSESEVTAVERELRRRGFESLELSMARRVADPDPSERRELCENLSRLPTAPGPWLFWLSYDPDPLVRRLAVTLMASSRDPRLHRRLREMQSLETDEKVRRQLDQLDQLDQ
ncbi:MAG: hypothetical protein ACODAD_00225 [Planctomycetota bacterium]